VSIGRVNRLVGVRTATCAFRARRGGRFLGFFPTRPSRVRSFQIPFPSRTNPFGIRVLNGTRVPVVYENRGQKRTNETDNKSRDRKHHPARHVPSIVFLSRRQIKIELDGIVIIAILF